MKWNELNTLGLAKLCNGLQGTLCILRVQCVLFSFCQPLSQTMQKLKESYGFFSFFSVLEAKCYFLPPFINLILKEKGQILMLIYCIAKKCPMIQHPRFNLFSCLFKVVVRSWNTSEWCWSNLGTRIKFRELAEL